MLVTCSCHWMGHGSRGCTEREVVCHTGLMAVTMSVAAAARHVAGKRPGSHGVLAGARWSPAPQVAAADWVAYPEEQDLEALHLGAGAAGTRGAASACLLEASPTRCSLGAVPCGLESAEGLGEHPGVAGALLEGACAGGLVAGVQSVGAHPQWEAEGPAGWPAAVAGARSVEVVAAEAEGDQEGAPGVADRRASSGEVGSLVYTEAVEGPAQSAVAPREACAPGWGMGDCVQSGPVERDPEAPAVQREAPGHHHPSGTGHVHLAPCRHSHLSCDRTFPCNDPCGALHGKTRHTPATVTKIDWACGFAFRSDSSVDDCTL